MNTIYTYPKRNYDKEDVVKMYLFFDNGDHISICGSEIVDISVNVYDKLVWHKQGAVPVAESGRIKLKISEQSPLKFPSQFIYNPKDYRENRKSYIENRCVQDSVTEMWLFNENNWYNVIMGNIQAKVDGEYLVLEYLPQPFRGSATGETHYICLTSVKSDNVLRIKLDFENCEVIEVYTNEILEVNLTMNEQLQWGASELYRGIKSGFIKIKLDERLGKRKNGIFDDNLTTKQIERRLCGRRGWGEHDLCHLYVTFYHDGFANNLTECIEIDDIRSDEELEEIDERYENGEYDFAPEYIGGHCAKLQDGSIVIAFGVNSDKTINKFSKKL